MVLLMRTITFAQRSELGIFIGTAYYIGDLNPNKHFTKTNSSGGIVYRYNFNPRWAFKVSALFGQLEGSDKETNYNNDRNLSFRSPISEISTQIEFNFFNLYTQKGKNNFSPYMFVGLSAFSFNPQAQLSDNQWYDLQPLGTEGQGLDKYPNKDYYSLTNVSMPFGIGLKVNFLKNFSFGVEWGMRKTWTDYIDDVGGTYADNDLLFSKRSYRVADLADRSTIKHIEGSARGNSRTKDWYNFTGFWLTFKLFEGAQSCGAYQKSTYRSSKVGKKK